jgi:SH3 domain-containing protein
MAETGTVSASALNLRQTPGGTLIRALPQGTMVEILDDQGEFLEVTADGQTGFVKASFIQRQSPAAPPANVTGSGSFHFDGNTAVAPDGTRFGKKFKLGVFNLGNTSIAQFVSQQPNRFASLEPSRLRVMQAVSANEGMLEAINTFDNAFLTFGAFQWTAGAGDGAGELPSLIDRLKRSNAVAFDQFFGKFGLDTALIKTPATSPATGFFTLDGATLGKAADKETKLRTLEWAFRFFQAGHDDAVRQVEVEHAAGRIDLFYRTLKVRNRAIADYVTSEFGVALILDEHVNRPGHVNPPPGQKSTIGKAIDQFVGERGSEDPGNFTDSDERRLLEIYIQIRNQTTMTDPQKRANTVHDAVNAGLASDKRGSYRG